MTAKDRALQRAGDLAAGARRLQPEMLNVAPALVGVALGTPGRRALAMGIDLAVVGLLTGVSGAWLAAGLVLVVLQLRQRRRGGVAGRREWAGWLMAAVVALLLVEEAGNQWRAWQQPAAAEVAEEEDEAAPPAPPAAASAVALSASDALAQAEARAQARIEKLQAELAEARKPRSLMQHLRRFLDDLGAGLGWGIVYFSLLPAWWGGQTVGKKLLRLRVVELTGQPMTVMRSLKRYGGYAAGLATGGLGFLQILWEPNRQGLHDKAAHTAVLDLRVADTTPAPLPGPETG